MNVWCICVLVGSLVVSLALSFVLLRMLKTLIKCGLLLGGFLHKSDVGDKWVSWGFHWFHHSTFVDWFPSFRFSCEKDKAFSCELCMNPLLHVMHVLCSPLLAVHAVYLFILNMQISALNIAATSFHSFVSLHQGLYLKGILRPSQAVIL